MHRFFLLLLGLASLFSSGKVISADPTDLVGFAALPPRVSANGYVSSYAGAQADLMVPVIGNETHNLYIDPSVAYATDVQGYADLGVGYRWTTRNDLAIIGTYLFGGYTRIANNARLWVANPGIEALGSRWDMRFNLYLPIGDRNHKISFVNSGPPFAASKTPSKLTGHSYFVNTIQAQLATYQRAGDGADIQVAYQFFPRVSLKGHVGGYFFAPSQANNVIGGATGFEYWLDPSVKVFADYSYDTLRRSTGSVGLGVEFGGTHIHRSDPGLSERITDPVGRYIAELGRGSAIPARKVTAISFVAGPDTIFSPDMVFFSQTGSPNNGGLGLTLANCTFENPCGPNDLTNAATATWEALLPNTMFWFNGGSYGALDVPMGALDVNLRPGQSVSSRTPDYLQPATGAARSTFSGGFILSNSNALNDVIMVPAPTLEGIGGQGTFGVQTNDVANFSIVDSQIGVSGNPYGVGIGHTGIPGIDSSSGTVSNTAIVAQDFGIAYGGPSLVVSNSTINVSGDPLSGTGVGVFVDTPNTNVNIIDSQINVVAPTTGGDATGIFVVTNNSTVTVTGTTVNASIAASTASAIGLLADGSGALIQFSQGAVGVAGPASTTLLPRFASSGGTVTIDPATVCIKNGSPTPC